MKNIIILLVCLFVFNLVSIAGEPGKTEQPQKISISTPPAPPPAATVVPPVVNNLSSSQSIVFGEKPLPETIKESPIVEKKPIAIESVESYDPNENVLTYEEQPMKFYSDEELVIFDKPTEETDGALYRLRDGVVQTLTFWRPWAYSNNPEKNPDALVDADGIIEKTDQLFRNFVVRGSTNSACRLVDGVWRIGTFPFPEAK